MTGAKIILGGGCFWCIEAAMQKIQGVTQVVSGYAGGQTENPDYRSVCSGSTGHAEVVQVEWDPADTNLDIVLQVFFLVHDPTSLNRQGNDIGTQYRSFIGYFDADQKRQVDSAIKSMQSELTSPIVTELQQAPMFYAAEIEHHDYYKRNGAQPYCQIIIKPKLDKLAQSKILD